MNRLLTALLDCASSLIDIAVTTFAEISLDDSDQISQILVGAHLRIYQRLDLGINVIESNMRHVGEARDNLTSLGDYLIGSSLRFLQSLNVGSKLRLLLYDEGHLSFEFFITHHEDLLN